MTCGTVYKQHGTYFRTDTEDGIEYEVWASGKPYLSDSQDTSAWQEQYSRRCPLCRLKVPHTEERHAQEIDVDEKYSRQLVAAMI